MFGFVSKKSYDDLADTVRRLIDERDNRDQVISSLRDEIKDWKEDQKTSDDAFIKMTAQLDTANARLARIAALETPNAAHGVRKAVRIAKGLD